MSDILKAQNEGKIIELLDNNNDWVVWSSSNIFMFNACKYRIAENQNNIIYNYTEHSLKVIEAFKNGKQIEKKHKNDPDDMFQIEENPECDFFYYRYRII